MGGVESSFLQDSSLSNNHSLNRFIDENIQPDEIFLRQCGAVIDTIYRHLQHEFQRELPSSGNWLKSWFITGKIYSVNRMIKGGSLGKGTAVLGKSDVDVVLFLNGFDSLQEFSEHRPDLLSILERFMKKVGQELENCEVKLKGTTRRAVKFSFKCDRDSPEIEVDLLPSFAIGFGKEGSIYKELEQLHHSERNDPVLTKKQVEFVKGYGPSVKRLIRLVKYWRKEKVPEGRYYPSSYPFELLTIHAWEKAGRHESFNTVQGFRQVLEYLVEYTEIKVMWTQCFDQSLLRDSGPIIIDPANPTLNVCKSWSTWREVANLARSALQSPMLSNVKVNYGWR